MNTPKTLLVVTSLVWVIAQACGTAPANSPPTDAVVTTTTHNPSLELRPTTTITAAPTTTATPSRVAKEEANAAYLEETIPPCTPVAGTNRDPCAAGTPPSIEPDDGVMISEAAKVYAPPLHEVLNYRDRDPARSVHIVLRGTVLPDTTRCQIFLLTLPTYWDDFDRKRFAGWEHLYCFSDVRVNEYLLGTGPPQLSVITNWDRPLGPEYRLGPPLDEQVIDTYEGVEGILFLSTGFNLQLEAWEMVYFWDVQQVGGVTRVIAPDKHEYPQTTENLALLDNTLEDFRTKITQAAATRTANTGGRVGTDPNLPLLITDANKLSTHYGAIGAVYDDPTQTPAKPPPVPGAEDPENPPANTGENETPNGTPPTPGDDQTPPVPGDDDEPPGSEP